MRRTVVSVALAIAMTVVGVAAAALTRGSTDRASRRASSTSSSATTSGPTTTTRGPRGSGQPVTFAFAGDVHFEGALRAALAADPDGLLAPVAPLLGGADVAIVNLETAVTEGGTPQAKAYTFRAPATAYRALVGAGADAASLANNHGVDYGPDGLQDTITSSRAAQFPLLGVGQNATEAYAPHRLEVKGQRISVFAATDVLDEALQTAWTATDAQPGLASAKGDSRVRLLAAVQAARVDSDTVVVFLHWGVEGQTCPSAAQQELARQLVDAGADIVVGSHAHRLQGAGRLGPAFVDYGLGNFVFYNESGESGRSGVLLVDATGRTIDSYRWAPARISGGVPHPLGGDAAVSEAAAWDGLRACTGLTP